MSVGDCLVLSYVLLGWAMHKNNGMYSPEALVLLCGSSLFFCGALLVRKRKKQLLHTGLPLMGLLVFFSLNMQSAPVLYLQLPWFERYVHAANMFFFLALPLVYVGLGNLTKLRSFLFRCAVFAAFLFRLLLPFASPAPQIDVFTITQDAAAHMLRGESPYSARLKDVYDGSTGSWGYVMEHYTYPPASLYPQLLAYDSTLDVRFALIAAEALFVCVLWRMFSSHRMRLHAELSTLLFLYHPRSLFVLEQGWNEPLLLGALSLFLVLSIQKRSFLAAFVYGYFLALKQYLVFLFLPYFILERKWKLIAVTLLTTGATLLPFLFWDPHGLLEQGILFQLQTPFRADSLSLPSFLHPFVGHTTKLLGMIVGLLAGAVSSFYFRRERLSGFLWAVTLTSFLLFLFGGQAFCNYYYFLGGLILLLLAHISSSSTKHQF